MHRLEDRDTEARAYYGTPYILGAAGRWNGANSPIDPWQHGHEGEAERGDREVLIAGFCAPGSAHCTGKPRGSGWDSGRTKLPNPRAPPMPSDADRGGGWGGAGVLMPGGGVGRLGPPSEAGDRPVPLLWTGVRHHPPGRTDKNLC